MCVSSSLEVCAQFAVVVCSSLEVFAQVAPVVVAV